MEIKELLETFKNFPGCITFSGAKDEDIAKLNMLNQDYKSFLKLTDGLIYNGIEFFGVEPHLRKEKDYKFPSIQSINKHYWENAFFESKTIVGRLSESLIIYDKKSDTYDIIDRIKLRSRVELDSFPELLKLLLGLLAIG